MDKVIGQVFTTTDYDKFVPNPRNRGGAVLDKEHVSRLAASFKKDGQHTPIEVDKSFNVGAGHHRLAAARKAGLPVKYTFVEKVDIEFVVQSHGLQKNWTLENIVQTYGFRAGYKPLIRLNQETKLSYGSIMVLMTGNTITRQVKADIVAGTFEVTAKMLLTFKKRYGILETLMSKATDDVTKKALTHPKVLRMLVVMMQRPGFSVDHLAKRLASGAKISTNNNLEIVGSNLENVYNMYLHGLDKISLVFEFKHGDPAFEAGL